MGPKFDHVSQSEILNYTKLLKIRAEGCEIICEWTQLVYTSFTQVGANFTQLGHLSSGTAGISLHARVLVEMFSFH